MTDQRHIRLVRLVRLVRLKQPLLQSLRRHRVIAERRELCALQRHTQARDDGQCVCGLFYVEDL